MAGKFEGLKIFTGNANPKLAFDVAKLIGIDVAKAIVSRFSDGEIEVKLLENVRGRDCFIIQPTSPPVNENLMELLIMIDALSRASAKSITTVIPYYGYARQDRKVEPRVPISAKLVANLITAAGADRIVTIDLHVGQIQGFFDIPVDNLYAAPVFLEYYRKNINEKDAVIVAPDAGGVERARFFANKLDTDLAIIDKRRPGPNEAVVMNVIGDVEDKVSIIIDDIVDTAKTLVRVAETLKNKGAKKVIAMCSHAVLSSDAIEKINNSKIEKLIVTDSISLGDKKSDKIVVVSVANLLAEAIKRIFNNESVSALFV